MLKDGAKAWEVKDFLVSQENCELVTIEGKDYYGRGSKQVGCILHWPLLLFPCFYGVHLHLHVEII